ncbi:winged helix family transcriptional regulator [Leucobacter sp. M11]|uniref:winged helix family transcriptional regulator n=1 Tax=Leucobacter sp. M11 TaxID=2993565 RepID=UPI002D80F2FE|nr:winged helix-turn-helix domain-containing protein [Leucobacter sp. M11]MEB4613970.1 winged helix-turn-helix domain-containing protein [Leucobacter sp. M11]
MARILLLSAHGAAEALPALGLLGHTLSVAPPQRAGEPMPTGADLAILDARLDLAEALRAAGLLARLHPELPTLGVFAEAGLAAVSAQWRLTGVVLDGAGPAELSARIRLALETPAAPLAAGPAAGHGAGTLSARGIVIDEASYAATASGRTLDLTYKEFELLRFLVANPGRVFTRDQLLHEVWGQDYFGGTRTVDVHIRRLRAKLGEHETLIGTVRNVGYRFNRAEDGDDPHHTDER